MWKIRLAALGLILAAAGIGAFVYLSEVKPASFVGRFPFPINLYDCSVKNPLGQITTFALTAITAGVGVLGDRFTLMLGIHHTDMELRPILRKSLNGLEDVVNTIVQGCTEDQSFKMYLPFKDKGREFVIKTGKELGVDFINTWSCHENTDVACGSCEGCREREAAFKIAGIDDPQVGRKIKVPVKAKFPAEVLLP